MVHSSISIRTTVMKQLPSRASRGARIHKLIGEEAEADDAFWSQNAWNESEQDSDYATEAGAPLRSTPGGLMKVCSLPYDYRGRRRGRLGL
jgi:hypothetical protein